MSVKKLMSLMLAVGVLTAGPLSVCVADDKPAAVAAPVAATKRPIVQLAICLDCSGSMDGLLEQAKTQIWRIVSQFATAKRKGAAPELQVALFIYGRSDIDAKENYVRNLLPLTTDLDKVSDQLFKLTTNGGEEYCGAVIKAATEGLAWSGEKDTLKLIFVCGNEPFTQGGVDYKTACKAAIEKGIIVNTIFCGPESEGVATNWKDGADRADGRYFAIDQNRSVPVIAAAPQDKEIGELNAKLNATYIPVGKAGLDAQACQWQQDANARNANAQVYAQRNLARSGAQYRCSWDLVDGLKDGKMKLEEIKAEDLPESLRKMSKDELKAHAEKMGTERAGLQDKLKELTLAREKFVTDELKKQAVGGADTLDAAVVKIIRDQAGKNGYQFE